MATNRATLEVLEHIYNLIEDLKRSQTVLKRHIAQQKRQVACQDSASDRYPGLHRMKK